MQIEHNLKRVRKGIIIRDKIENMVLDRAKWQKRIHGQSK